MLERYNELRDTLVIDTEELSNDELIDYYENIQNYFKKVSFKFYSLVALAAVCRLSTFPIKSMKEIDATTILAYLLSIGFVVCSINYFSLMNHIGERKDELQEIVKKRNLTL